ncbi:hypothetical protein LSAT2_028507 [Lamellibrachia satsuma]|nr:hypothetical protein LSAT2_028507 [Lamellibrachia satsuma]
MRAESVLLSYGACNTHTLSREVTPLESFPRSHAAQHLNHLPSTRIILPHTQTVPYPPKPPLSQHFFRCRLAEHFDTTRSVLQRLWRVSLHSGVESQAAWDGGEPTLGNKTTVSGVLNVNPASRHLVLSRLGMTMDQCATRLYPKPICRSIDSRELLPTVLLRVDDVDPLDELLVTSVQQQCRGVCLVSTHPFECGGFFLRTTWLVFRWSLRGAYFCTPLRSFRLTDLASRFTAQRNCLKVCTNLSANPLVAG